MPHESTCVRIAGGETYRGKQGLEYFAGLSAETAGTKGLCMHLVTIPPAGRARPHLHQNHESAVYVVSGVAGMWYGEGLREHMWAHAGDFIYIPANVPHLPYNASGTTPCVGLIARTDPNEQESVTLLEIEDPGVAEIDAGRQATETDGLPYRDAERQATETDDLLHLDAERQATETDGLPYRDAGRQATKSDDLLHLDAERQATENR